MTTSSVSSVPANVEYVLDLIPPGSLLTAINYNISEFYGDDWEPRHLLAAKSLCFYVIGTHGKQSAVGRSAERLLNMITKLYD